MTVEQLREAPSEDRPERSAPYATGRGRAPAALSLEQVLTLAAPDAAHAFARPPVSRSGTICSVKDIQRTPRAGFLGARSGLENWTTSGGWSLADPLREAERWSDCTGCAPRRRATGHSSYELRRARAWTRLVLSQPLRACTITEDLYELDAAVSHSPNQSSFLFHVRLADSSTTLIVCRTTTRSPASMTSVFR
jgi:hypothetical protein